MNKIIKPLSDEEIERLCFTPDGKARPEARELFRRNFIFFVYYILGYKDLGAFHLKEAMPLFEYIVGDFPYTKQTGDKKIIIQPNESRVLIELPRSTFKSTIFTVSACIWFIIRNPEIKIGLGSWKHDIAKGFLTEIKSHLEENDKLKRLYPEIFYDDPRKESPKWTDEMIRVIRMGKYKEHTIETFGIEKQPTSRHYDIIILDDVVNETNVTSNDIIQKTKDKFRLLTSLLVVPSNPIFVIGTRYHFNDLYSDLEDNEDWLTYKRPAVTNGVPLFPERLSLEELERVKTTQGTYIFSCQYLLTPMSPEDRTLNASLLKTYKSRDELPDNLQIYGGMDIAFSTTKRSDRTCIIVLGYDPVETNIYLLDGTVFRGEASDILEQIVAFGRKWHFKKFNIETIGMLGKILEKPIENELTKARVSLNYELIKGYGRTYTGGSKNEKPRIPIIVSPHLEAGRLFIPEKLIVKGGDKRVNLIAELKQEMEEYPFGKHDDIIDALALAIMAIPDFVPRTKKNQKNKKFDNYLKKYKNNNVGGYVYIRRE